MRKPSKIVESGLIGGDGKLRLPMDRVNAFLADHSQERVVVTFEVISRHSTIAQKMYYYRYVLPTIVGALREQGTLQSEDGTDMWLVEQCPCDLSVGGVRAVRASELTSDQMSDFLDWLKLFAAENLCVYIEDPKTI